VLKKKIWTNFQRIIELFAQKIVTKLSKVWVWDPGSEIRDPEKTYSGSRIQGSKRHRIPDPDPQHWFLPCLYSKRICSKTLKIRIRNYKSLRKQIRTSNFWLKQGTKNRSAKKFINYDDYVSAEVYRYGGKPFVDEQVILDLTRGNQGWQ
jgi:hypothetical protein